jgi:hypothetical protein
MLTAASLDTDVKVLLVHHSWFYRGSILEMDSGSKTALEAFVNNHGIHVLLTGHTHGPFIGRVGASTNGSTYEFCCGTTTQLDHIPYDWSRLMGGMPKQRKWPENTLILHRIVEDDQKLKWRAQIWRRTRTQGGFQTVGKPITIDL